MRQFAETDEMQAFIANARAQRRKVVVKVFHSADGHPMLIHTTILRKKNGITRQLSKPQERNTA